MTEFGRDTKADPFLAGLGQLMNTLAQDSLRTFSNFFLRMWLSRTFLSNTFSLSILGSDIDIMV